MEEINIGSPIPLGSSVTHDGVNFCLVATNAEFIELLIFENDCSKVPKSIYTLNENFRTGSYWHIEVKGLTEGALYAYRVHQKNNNKNRDYSKKVIIDPCSRGIVGWENFERKQFTNKDANVEYSLKSVVCKKEKFNFNDFPRPNHNWDKTIIYELHVGAFTKNIESYDSSDRCSCFKKILQKIPYLKELGITTLELMPIFCFDPSDSPNGLENFWGYSPINWFTPHFQFFSDKSPKSIRQEFKNFVEECHKNDIEIILDVVYNHTSEGNMNGPVFSWKGIDENLYYFIDKNRNFQDVSGCGNTIAANRSLVRKLIIESLKCWSTELGVDGFRFDLGIALSRGENLIPLDNPPLFEDIEADPELANIKLISEPWDCGGLYKLKDFPSSLTFTWNGVFRDDVRRFWKGEENTAWNMSDKIQGSPQLYNKVDQKPKSINFITSHDGFTLKDLVSFNQKHNFANREQNKDGENNNNSWNHGVEGPTFDKEIKKLRKQQQKNLLFSLFISRGVPMISMGDEVGRSQGGNNNTWCQNNSLGCMNWNTNNQDLEIFNYLKYLIQIRKKFNYFINSSNMEIPKNLKKINYSWHGTEIDTPDWSSWSHTLAFSISKNKNNPLIWIALNAYSKNIKFCIPKTKSKWLKIIDTSESSIFEPKIINEKYIEINHRSSVLIVAEELLGSNNQYK